MTTSIAAPPTRSARYRRVMESLSIRSEKSTIVPMRFSQSQEVLWQRVAPRIDAGEKLWFICLKGRQLYCSTFFQALMFTRTMSAPNTNSLVLAQDLFSSHVLFDMAKRFYDHFPMPRMRAPTAQELSFPFPGGESRYRVISAGKAAKGRGANFTCVHASEAAFYERPDVMLGLAQTLPDLPHTMWVIESTANGRRGPGEYFYNEWRNAVSGESDLIHIFIPWYVLPKYRRTPAVPQDDWTKREQILATTFGLDGEQLAWRRAYIKTKCIAGDTRVGTNLGIIPIRDAQEASFCESGVVAKWIPQPYAKVVRLTTTAGRILRATDDHPIKTSDDVWTPIGVLQPGDEVQLSPPKFATREAKIEWSPGGVLRLSLDVTPTVGLFLGYFMGDGSWSNDTIEVTCDAKDSDVVGEVAKILEHISGRLARRRLQPGSGRPSLGAVRVQTSVRWCRELFVSAGLIAQTSGTKYRRLVCVPDAIWRSPDVVVKQFLSGLFEADGTAAMNQVRLSTSHENFARDVQLLLLGFSIPASIQPRKITLTSTGKIHDTWNVVISGKTVELFFDTIGFRGARKQGRRPVRSDRGRKPADVRLVDRVKSVEPDGSSDTFDLTVEPMHQFSANGIAVHNCQGDEVKFDQEYPVTPEVAFIATGSPAFSADAVLEHRKNVREPVERGYLRKTGDKRFVDANARGWLRVWERPQAGCQYVIGADTAEGLEDELGRGREGDYACAQVIDMKNLEQVACIHGHIPPWDFADALNELGRWYNNATVAVEINNHGHSVQDRLIRELFYPNLHRWRGKPDRHMKMANASRVYGWECIDPDALILTADLRWVPACLIKTGHRILGCREDHDPGKRVRHLRVQTVVATHTFMAPLVDVELDNGRQTRVSATHPFLATRQKGAQWHWVEAAHLQPGDFVKCLPVWEELRDYDAGRLSAFLDGEGHLCQGTLGGLQMLISQAEGLLAQEIVELWSRLGFDSTFKWLRHKRPHEKPIATSGVLRLPDVLRALGSLRPTRLLRRFAERVEIERFTVKSIANVVVRSVSSAGEGPVIGLTTDPDHTLIADGIIGHNTNNYSRPLMIDSGRRVINTGLVTIREEKLLDEIMSFSMMDNGKYEAEYGHDDRVVALLIALRSREENYFPARARTEVSEEIPDSGGVRIVEGRDHTADGQRQISKILRKQAKQDTGEPWYYRKFRRDQISPLRDRVTNAVKSWMDY